MSKISCHPPATRGIYQHYAIDRASGVDNNDRITGYTGFLLTYLRLLKNSSIL